MTTALFDPAVHADPYPTYARLRDECPVHHDGQTGMWWLFRYADCEEALRSPRLGSPMGPPELTSMRLGDGPAASFVRLWMLSLNPPEHTALRRLVSNAFTAGAVEAMRPRIAERVDRLLDGVLSAGRSEFDLMAEVAYRIPIAVICGMLGVAEGDHDRFRNLIEENAAVIEPMPSPDQVKAADRASAEMMAFLTDLAARRRVEPQDDLLSALVAVEEDGRSLTDDEVAGNAGLLIAAGFSTSMLLIGNAVLALLRHPKELDRLRQAPETAGAVVDETLRYDPPIQMWGRTVLEDAEIGGVTIPAGSPVLSVLGSANRDPAVFERPDEFDPGRPAGPHRHLSFGGGVHRCLGAPLARLEAEVTLTALVTRVPDLALAAGDPETVDNMSMRGPKELRVTV